MAWPLKVSSSAAMLMMLILAAVIHAHPQDPALHIPLPLDLLHPRPVEPHPQPVEPQPQPQPMNPFDPNSQVMDLAIQSTEPFDPLAPEIVPGAYPEHSTLPSISIADIEAHLHDFQPGHWKRGHATFYTGDEEYFGGACGYLVGKEGYGEATAAVSSAMFRDGKTCGACFELKCVDNPKWCKPGQPSLFLTATNFCPPNFHQDANYGGWCNPPRKHFDISYPAFGQLARYKVGIIPVAYRRVPCKKQGGIKFTITGNQHFTLVHIFNVGGAGEVAHVDVKGDDKLDWSPLSRNWGTKWQTSTSIENETLTFKVTTKDGRSVISPNVTPNKYWQYGHTFEGLNFR